MGEFRCRKSVQLNWRFQYQSVWGSCKKIVIIEPAAISSFSGEVPGAAWVHFARGLGVAVVPEVHFAYSVCAEVSSRSRDTFWALCAPSWAGRAHLGR